MKFSRRLVQRFAVPTLYGALLSLAGCGGGADNPLASLYTGISITSVNYPDSANTNSSVTVKAKASSSGEISDGDIEWHFDQTSGKDISGLVQTLSDSNHTATFDFQTPSDSGTICFKLKVENSNHYYVDSSTLCINVR